MTDDTNNNTNPAPAPETTEQDYISAIQTLRENTVPSLDYQKLLDENKRLISALTKGDTIAPKSPTETKKQIEDLRKDLKTANGRTNLEYISTALKLRDAVLEAGGRDPFLPNNSEYVDNPADEEASKRLAEELQSVVDYCEGDPKLFNSELQRRCGRR